MMISLINSYPTVWQDDVNVEENPSTQFFRREQFDPYGFNSILTRFYKRQSPILFQLD